MHPLRYDAGAGAYDRLTGRWSRMYVECTMSAAQVGPGSHVLDVATGTGDAAIVAVDLVGPSGKVVAVDISGPMLREAASKAGARHIEFVQADAQRLHHANGSFDAIVCLFGVMFLPHQIEALKGFRRVLRPGGRVVATSWGTPAQTPFAGLLAEALSAQLPNDRADLLRPFCLSNPEVNTALYKAAGFADVRVTMETRLSPFSSFDDDFWEPVEAGGGRLGQAYLGLSPSARRSVRQQVLGQLPVHATTEPFALQHSAWVVTASG